MTTSGPIGRSRSRDAEGALDTLTEGLELNGIRVPSLGLDVASLADSSGRTPLIHLGSIAPSVARQLGKALLAAHAATLRDGNVGEAGSRGGAS